jgi:regulator of cell morphogenesis and NO signaling
MTAPLEPTVLTPTVLTPTVLTPTATVGDLVVADARRAAVFDRAGIDYCCNGHRTVAEAARDAELDVDDLLRSLDLPGDPASSAAPATGVTGDGGARELSSLAHDIVDTHHAYLWEEMPRLQALVDKVHGVHGDRHPELAEVRATYAAIVADLDPHLAAEERRVFPMIRRLESGATASAPVLAAALADDLRAGLAALRAEHDHVGGLLRQLRSLTGGYAVPADSCGSYRAMLAGLEAMEKDIHEHIHKENNILFVRVEALLAAGGTDAHG